MASMRGVAFAIGALGLAAFLAGVAWAVMAPTGCPEADRACQKAAYSTLLVRIQFLWIGGLVLEAVAVGFMFAHFRQRRTTRGPPERPAAPRGYGGDGPVVTVTRRNRP